MSKTKLVFFFRGGGGGVGKVIPRIARNLRSQDWEVETIASNLSQHNAYQSEITDLKSKRLFFSLGKLRKYLKGHNVSILFCAAHFPSLLGFIAILLARTKTILVPSVRTNVTMTMLETPLLLRPLLRASLGVLINRSAQTIAVSEGVKADLIQNFGAKADKICVIYPPVLTPEIAAKSEEPTTDQWINDPALKVILSVGRLTKQKDFPTLIRAMALITQQRNDIRLMIVGDGPEKANLEKLILDNHLSDFILMKGHQKNPYKFYKRCDLFALTAQWGGLDNVLVEAIYFGLPVVCTNFNYGPSELVHQGLLKDLAPIADYASIARLIENSLSTTTNQNISDEAFNIYSLDAVTKKHRELFHSLLSEKHIDT